jgi:flagellar hook assembly protein FlgD
MPGEYRLYTTRKLPSSKLILGTEDILMPGGNDIITAYPNPSGGEFNFILRDGIRGPVTISIFDMTGRIVMQKNISVSGSEIITWDGRTINGTEAPEGLYIAIIRSASGYGTVKLVRQ